MSTGTWAPQGRSGGPEPPVGLILPGTIQVVAIEPQPSEDGPRWRITLRGVAAGARTLGAMTCELTFVTADPALVEQVRMARYRYVLDLIQLQRAGDETGRVEDTDGAGGAP